MMLLRYWDRDRPPAAEIAELVGKKLPDVQAAPTKWKLNCEGIDAVGLKEAGHTYCRVEVSGVCYWGIGIDIEATGTITRVSGPNGKCRAFRDTR